jgi:predicted dehydrogenase
VTARIDVVAVGFGGIGSQDHQSAMYLPALAAHPSFRIAGVADAAGTAGAAKAAVEYGVPHLPDLDAALAAAPVVCVAVPLADRYGVVGAAIRAGRHVLADKPLAATAGEAAELAALAARHGVAVVPRPPCAAGRRAAHGPRRGSWRPGRAVLERAGGFLRRRR